METIQIALFVILGVLSYRSILFGSMALLTLSCTFSNISQLFIINNVTNGSWRASDFIIIAILLKTIQLSKLRKTDTAYIVCLILIAWTTLSTLLAVISDQAGLRELYRSTVRVGLFWILPISIRDLSYEQKIKLAEFVTLLAITVSLLQIYVLISKNQDLLSIFYPTPEGYYGHDDSNSYWDETLLTTSNVRLYPPGALLIQMTFPFLISIIALQSKTKNYLIVATTIITCMIFILSLSGKANTLGMIFSVLTTIAVSLFNKKGVNLKNYSNSRQTLLSILILAPILYTITTFFGAELNIGYSFERIIDNALNGSHSTIIRMNDNIEAVSTILESPLWGIGQSKVHWSAAFESEYYGGQDIHPFLMQALLTGVPGLLILLFFIGILISRLKLLVKINNPSSTYILSLSAASSLAYALFLSFANTTPAFMYSSNQVPFGLFCGFLLTRLTTRQISEA